MCRRFIAGKNTSAVKERLKYYIKIKIVMAGRKEGAEGVVCLLDLGTSS